MNRRFCGFFFTWKRFWNPFKRNSLTSFTEQEETQNHRGGDFAGLGCLPPVLSLHVMSLLLLGWMPSMCVSQTGKRGEKNQRGFEDFRGWWKNQQCSVSLGVQGINSVCASPTGTSCRDLGFAVLVPTEGSKFSTSGTEGDAVHVGFCWWGVLHRDLPEDKWQCNTREMEPHGALGLLGSRWQEGEPLGKKTILIRKAWSF